MHRDFLKQTSLTEKYMAMEMVELLMSVARGQ